MLRLLVSLIDRFEPKQIMRNGDHRAAAFSFVSGDVHIDGMDYIRLNATGLIEFLPFGSELVKDLTNEASVMGRKVTAKTLVNLRKCPHEGDPLQPPLKAGQSFALKNVFTEVRLGTLFFYTKLRRSDIK